MDLWSCYSMVNKKFPRSFSTVSSDNIGLEQDILMVRLCLVESLVIVPFCIITSMHDALIINYQLFLY